MFRRFLKRGIPAIGGRAIAETLFGGNNPAGRLPVSFPKSVGQLRFSTITSVQNNNYIDGNDSPQFVFGFGLSYTTFKYDHLTVTPPTPEAATHNVSFDLTNTGDRDGDEVAQLYVHQTTASVATPIEALKAFSRVHLNPEKKNPSRFMSSKATLPSGARRRNESRARAIYSDRRRQFVRRNIRKIHFE